MCVNDRTCGDRIESGRVLVLHVALELRSGEIGRDRLYYNYTEIGYTKLILQYAILQCTVLYSRCT